MWEGAGGSSYFFLKADKHIFSARFHKLGIKINGKNEWEWTYKDNGVHNNPSPPLFIALSTLDPHQFVYYAVDAIAERNLFGKCRLIRYTQLGISCGRCHHNFFN